MSKKALILILILALSAMMLFAQRKAHQVQVSLIEAYCERLVSKDRSPAELPGGKVCEVTGYDIWTEVTVRAGPHERMECDEILWPLFEDVTASCGFVP